MFAVKLNLELYRLQPGVAWPSRGSGIENTEAQPFFVFIGAYNKSPRDVV